MDLAALLQQDGKAAEAIAVFEKAAIANPPEYALLAATTRAPIATSAATTMPGAWPAKAWSDFPSNPVCWPLLLSLALSDSGHSAEALELLRGPAVRGAKPVERLLAGKPMPGAGGGDPFRALQVYTAAMQLDPADQGIRQRKLPACCKAWVRPMAPRSLPGA